MSKVRNGADYERKIVNEAREKGLIAYRCAASKSGKRAKIDVTIIDDANHTITLLQCKKGSSYTDGEKRRITDTHKFLNGTYVMEFKVI